jgi:hypothetical protein
MTPRYIAGVVPLGSAASHVHVSVANGPSVTSAWGHTASARTSCATSLSARTVTSSMGR